MSFILDALRKSDARRQQSGAPGLNSPEPPRPPRRRPRLLPGVAAAVVLFAILATAVYFVRPEWLPLDIGDDRQVADSQSSSPPPEPDPGQAGQAESTTADEQVADEADMGKAADAGASSDAEQSQAQSDQSRDRRRRRVPPSEQGQVAQQGDAVQAESPQRESAPVPAEEARKELERRMAESASRRREEAVQPPEEPEPAPARQTDREASPREQPHTGEQDPEAGSEALNEGVAEYVRVWELPLSVRRSLPEMNLTIHVYSPNEPERFVLINGERRVAGDQIDGARIVDIRREGAVVDFRSHRFLLEPR